MALDQAFVQVAQHRGEHRHHRGDQQARQVRDVHAGQPAQADGHGDTRQQAAEQAFPGLVGADARGQLVPAEVAAGEIGTRIGGPHQRQRGQQPQVAVVARRIAAGMDQHQRGPGRDDGEGAGQQLEDAGGTARLRAEGEETQPDQGGQPPGHANQGRQLEQHQRTAIGPDHQHHQQQVQHQQHGTGQGVFDAGQLQPFPQADQEHGGGGGSQPLGRQQQDRGNGHRRHDQRGENSGLGHGLGVSVARAAIWALVRPKRRSRLA